MKQYQKVKFEMFDIEIESQEHLSFQWEPTSLRLRSGHVNACRNGASKYSRYRDVAKK